MNSFLDIKWFQGMMKDCMVANVFLGALFDPDNSNNTIFFLNKIICISCSGFNLIDQIIKFCMSGHKDEFY